MTRQVVVTEELGRIADATLSSRTCSGKGKLMEFVYVFVDVKNYSGHLQSLKHSLSPWLANDRLKG